MRTKDFGYRVNHLEQEARSVLDWATIRIRSLIRTVPVEIGLSKTRSRPGFQCHRTPHRMHDERTPEFVDQPRYLR